MEYTNRKQQAPDLNVLPSEHLKSGRIFFHTELEERGLARAIEDLNDDVFFCASDFPHEPKGEFPEAVHEFMGRSDLNDAAKRKILWDNPLRMYALDQAQLPAR
jgi:predicted TIM-barrel fold metal-dependent hydrolase